MSTPLPEQLLSLVGPGNVVTDAGALAAHLVERRGLFHGRALALVSPASTAETAAVVRLAWETATPIVPQGGNTGLVGGAVPDGSGAAIILSLHRMNGIRAVDPSGNTMTVEAGATLADARRAAEAVDRLFPLSLAPQETCTIGGNIATNAGGLAVLAYGSMRDFVLGLEVVLADGRIWNGLRTLRKDNTGYDLARLFAGSEGTLGIITAAALELFARPRSVATAFAGVGSPDAALALFRRAREEAGPSVTAAEIIPAFGLELARAKLSASPPLSHSHAWYVLIELSSAASDGLDTVLRRVLDGALQAGEVEQSAMADSAEMRRAFWALRETMSDAQGAAGASIKHDVAVPVADVPRFILEATAAAQALIPGCRPVPFGHLGDGNIHFNITQPVGVSPQSFLGRWAEMNEVVHAVVARFDGSIAAEHGIGRLKAGLMPTVKSEVELDLMRALKDAFDPSGILNPGVLLPPR